MVGGTVFFMLLTLVVIFGVNKELKNKVITIVVLKIYYTSLNKIDTIN